MFYKSNKFCNYLALNKNNNFIMATYTITINERTAIGRNLLRYLQSLGVVVDEKNSGAAATQKSIDELKKGKVTRCKTFDDYLKCVKNA